MKPKLSSIPIGFPRARCHPELIVGFGIARMYEAVMDGSSIHARAFRDRQAVAEWLEVPLEALQED